MFTLGEQTVPFRRIKEIIIGISLLLLSLVQSSLAVTLSSDAKGEALILPVFSTSNDLSTLITVSNTNTEKERPAATKITFRDRDGMRLLTVNAYVNESGAWVAAMESGESGARIEFPGPICTLGGADDQITSVTEATISERIGFVEIIELGVLNGGTPASRSDKGLCEELADEWNSGEWSENGNNLIGPPTSDLKASASLINVKRGTMYSVAATALSDFSDISQHTLPGSALPDLSSAHDSGTDAGQTTSTVCSLTGCIEDTWARPVDAVAAALLAHEFGTEFVIEAAIDASTELVLTYPLRRHYMAGESFREHDIALLTSNRLGEHQPVPEPCLPPIPGEFPCERSFVLPQSRSVEIIDFTQRAEEKGTIQPSNILGLVHEVIVFREALPESGTAKAGLRNLGADFISNEGTKYLGVPTVSVVLQRYVNGTLEDETGAAVLANYGDAFPTTRTVRTN